MSVAVFGCVVENDTAPLLGWQLLAQTFYGCENPMITSWVQIGLVAVLIIVSLAALSLVSIPVSLFSIVVLVLGVSIIILIYRNLRFYRELSQTAQAIGLVPRSSLDELVPALCQQVTKFHSLYFKLDASPKTDHVAVMIELRRIVEMAYQEFNANSAELALFDEQSGLWTQAILVGVPRSEYAQSFLLEAASNQRASDELLHQAGVLVAKVTFANYLFGTFRIELGKGVIPTNEHQNILRLLAIHCAITLINARFTDELIRMRKHSEESVKAKTGFLANLSHEIRGPLGVIISGVELMLEGICGEVSEQQGQTLQMIKKNGEHLLDLVNDVLDYAKTEAGKIKAEPVTLAVNDLLSDLCNVVRSQANAKQQKLSYLAVDKKWGLICDKRHARQILINMLTNAIKYTPNNGTITVAAELEDGARIKISVTDTGIGIPEDQKSKVFSAFERVEDKYAEKQVGTGLGMPIAYKLCAINKGVMEFTSTQGVGSCFWISMPYTTCASAEVDVESAGDQNGAQIYGHGEKLLLVQPDNEEKQILERYLTYQGFDVESACSSREIQKLLRGSEYSLMVIDNDFDEVNAEELLAIIRNNPLAKELPIIMVSARAFFFDVEHFLKLGVERCLSKPLDLPEFARVVATQLAATKSAGHKPNNAVEAVEGRTK